MLHKNQQRALTISHANSYESGIHSHATGTGKSWIALELINQFKQSRAPTPVKIMWICEQKSILQEQFTAETIATKGFTEVIKQFLVQDFTTVKNQTWPAQINQAAIWRRSQLIIINRAFLTSQNRYTNIQTPIDLIVHDECHSIRNKSTQEFYAHIQSKWPTCRVIGFSATPCVDYAPLMKVLSHYSIADAVADRVILPPTIHWLKSHESIDDEDIYQTAATLMAAQPYKKAVVWCGMIAHCFTAATKWRRAFPDYMIAVDTSDGTRGFASYEDFSSAEGKAFLFCAAKHREGSDIANLDTCIFLDRVENRNAKTFVQCVGRVLRHDAARRKQTGVILDVSAASSIRICDRMNEYLNQDSDAFPFNYYMSAAPHNPKIQLHALKMLVDPQPPTHSLTNTNITAEDLKAAFVRPIPAGTTYATRLAHELELIVSKNLGHYLLRAVEVLKITEGIPHVTRGSCGSSLTVYLLGISHVDPVKYDISFARFLNEFRDTLPDIDFDFPYNLRDEVFLQLHQRWPGKIARISNHIHYHEKSAIRQAAKEAGLKGNLSTLEVYNKMRALPSKTQQQIRAKAEKLKDTFRGYSLHCGGVIFYPEGVPKHLKLNNRTVPQVRLDKRNVADEKHFKIDILSSRALAILYECLGHKPINFEEWTYDEATADLFCQGDNVGIILGESPLIRKAYHQFQPRSLDDLAICLAIIRPAARDAKKAVTTADLAAKRVYDDDAITLIATTLKCSEAEADRWRRGLTKEDPKVMAAFAQALKALTPKDKSLLVSQLENLRDYSFCKAHAYSYAQLVWKLAWCKVHMPTEFWTAVMKHSDSYYRRWVHIYEARLAGVDVEHKGHASIYAAARRRKASTSQSDSWAALRSKGAWEGEAFLDGCYLRKSGDRHILFKGAIASFRVIDYGKVKTAVVCVGVGPKKYIDVLVKAKHLSLTSRVGIQGSAQVMDDTTYVSNADMFKLF
jgi:hypothetical protein